MAHKIASASVFVSSIVRVSSSEIHVEAENGSSEGPPFLRFSLPKAKGEKCHIGKRYDIEVYDPDLYD